MAITCLVALTFYIIEINFAIITDNSSKGNLNESEEVISF